MTYKKYVTFSYDDGVKQDIRLLELFNRYGLKGTFNLDTGRMPIEPDTSGNRISHTEIPAVYAGHEIATHGYSHPYYTKMEPDAIREDITKNRDQLKVITGASVIGHAYPYGAYNEEVTSVLKDCGIRYARTTQAACGFLPPADPMVWHPTCHHAHADIFKLMDAFLETNPTDSDMLLYIWGHSYELDWEQPQNNWNHMEKICKHISGRKDVCYVTNLQFLERK